MDSFIQTERLLLRPWLPSDLAPFATLNADPEVMRYFPATMTREESDKLAAMIQQEFEENGWGLWAVSIQNGEPFIGFIGLHQVGYKMPFTPAVEIGWRLAKEYWGKGYATEGAQAVLRYAFETLALPKIVSFTAVPNLPSQRVMEKLGMHRNPKDDFDHPKLPEGHPLRRHVLYQISRDDWAALQ